MTAIKHMATIALVALTLGAGNAHGSTPATRKKQDFYSVMRGSQKSQKQKKVGISCDEAYECDFVVLEKSSGNLYQFNLNGLCAAEDYEAESIAKSNGKVQFNICGLSNNHCLPEGNPNVPYVHGVAIQKWGPPPTTTNCEWNPTGEVMECTEKCEVIGRGIPSFELMDPNNAETGGIRLAHRAAIASKVDPWECTVERDGESFAIERHATYEISCDETVDLLAVDGAKEHPECHYKVQARSKHACGTKVKEDLEPINGGNGGNTANNSGNGGGSGAGIGAGMFFFGIFMFAMLAGGYYWWRNRKSGYSPFGSSAASSASESSGLRTTGTGGVGSSSL